MTQGYRTSSTDDSDTLLLRVVGWIVSDQARAERMLALTGLDPDTLRAGLTQPAVLRALLDFVLDHEPDLLACADALGVKPAEIAAARGRIVR
jgi:hypothetical protein